MINNYFGYLYMQIIEQDFIFRDLVIGIFYVVDFILNYFFFSEYINVNIRYICEIYFI